MFYMNVKRFLRKHYSFVELAKIPDKHSIMGFIFGQIGTKSKLGLRPLRN